MNKIWKSWWLYWCPLFENGFEAEGGSRKMSIFQRGDSNTGLANMTTISAAFVDIIMNNATIDVTVTYVLNEILSEPGSFRFNM